MTSRLRVRTGVIAEAAPHGDLQILHRSRNLLVEGTGVQVIHGEAGRCAFLAGHVVGVRTAPDALSTGAAEVRRAVMSPDEAAEALEGRFVLTIVDGDEAVVMTDRFGQRDLYLQHERDGMWMATDLTLLPVPREGLEYDQAALAHALTVYGYRPPKRHTAYRGVSRLGIGQRVRCTPRGCAVESPPFRPMPVRSYGEADLHRYADFLLDAVAARGSREGNVVYLSSGWDSTTLLACLVRIFGPRRVRAVTGRMHYAERSGVINKFEIDRAQAMAEYFGVRLDVVEWDYSRRGPEVIEELQPLLHAHQVPSITALNCELLAAHVARTADGDEVIFAGEISDGAHNLGFSQFTTIFHPVLDFREYSDKMASYLFGPTFLGQLLAGGFVGDAVYGLLRGRQVGAVFDDPAPDDVARRRQLLASFFSRAVRLPLWSLRNSRLLTDAGREAYTREIEVAYLGRAAEELSPETLYSWYLHLYNSFHWQGSTVAAIPLTAEAHGLRVALPFWDSRLQEFLAAMPEAWGRGLDLNPTKFPLKWMLRNRIDYPLHLQVGPHSYLYDVDPSFSHSAEILYGSAFASYFRGLLQKREYEAVLSPETFAMPYIDGLVRRYASGGELRGPEMNDLLSLSLLSMVGWYGAPNG